jgi:hypothetical protein
MAAAFGVPYLGRLPMDPNMMKACDSGYGFVEAFPTSIAVRPFLEIIDKIISSCAQSEGVTDEMPVDQLNEA